MGVVEDTVVEGDRVAARVTCHGTHRGDLVGIPGTGVPVTMQSVQILKFTNGLASEWWGTADVFGVLRQVGASRVPLTRRSRLSVYDHGARHDRRPIDPGTEWQPGPDTLQAGQPTAAGLAG